MKVLGDKSISKWVKIALQILFMFGIGVYVLLPWVVKWYIQIVKADFGNLYGWVLTILYLSGIPAIVIVYQFIQLFDSLKRNEPFQKKNTKYLKIASGCSLLIAIEFCFGSFIFKSIFTIIIAGIFFIAWLGLYILAELFQQAVEFKEENDLTI